MDQKIPNEIFILIFEYLSISDLFHAFYGLNLHINSILNRIPIKLDKLYDIQIRQYVLPNINPTQIQILKIFYNGYEKFKNIQQFTNIRYLKFYLEPSINQLNQIQPTYLLHLETLNIEKSNSLEFSNEYINLCKTIFSGEFQTLKNVKLPYIDYKHIRFVNHWSTILTSLEISNCTKNAFYMILENLSNLEIFHVTICTYELHQVATKYLNLKKLYLTMYKQDDIMNTSMDELFSLCMCLRNIEYAMISLFYSDTIQNAFRDLNVLLSFCQRLDLFDFFIKINQINFNNANIDAIKRQYGLLKNTETFIYQSKKFYYCRIRKSYLTNFIQ